MWLSSPLDCLIHLLPQGLAQPQAYSKCSITVYRRDKCSLWKTPLCSLFSSSGASGCQHKTWSEGIPWRSRGWDSAFSLPRAWVWSLAGELESHKTRGAAKKKRPEVRTTHSSLPLAPLTLRVAPRHLPESPPSSLKWGESLLWPADGQGRCEDLREVTAQPWGRRPVLTALPAGPPTPVCTPES